METDIDGLSVGDLWVDPKIELSPKWILPSVLETPKLSQFSTKTSSDSPGLNTSPYLKCSYSSSTTDAEENKTPTENYSILEANLRDPDPLCDQVKHFQFPDALNFATQDGSDWFDNMTFTNYSNCDNNTVVEENADNSHQVLADYFPDFSDFQDETYAFWQPDHIRDDINQNAATLASKQNNSESFEKPDTAVYSVSPRMKQLGTLPSFDTIKQPVHHSSEEFPLQNSQFNVIDSSDNDSNNFSLCASDYIVSSELANDNIELNNLQDHKLQETRNLQHISESRSTEYHPQLSVAHSFSLINQQDFPTVNFDSACPKTIELTQNASRGTVQQCFPRDETPTEMCFNKPCYLLTTNKGDQFLIVGSNQSSNIYNETNSNDASLSSSGGLQVPVNVSVSIVTPVKLEPNYQQPVVCAPVTVLPASNTDMPPMWNPVVRPSAVPSSVPYSNVPVNVDPTPKVPITLLSKRVLPPCATSTKKATNMQSQRKTVREMLEENKLKRRKDCNRVLLPSGGFIYSSVDGNTQIQEKPVPKICSRTDTDPNISSVSKQTDMVFSRGEVLHHSSPNYFCNETLTSIPSTSNDVTMQMDTPTIFDVPTFHYGRVDAKEHKPRHYDLLRLIIGNFRIESKENTGEKIHSKLKVLFTKRQFIYEFQLTIIPGMKPSKRMVCFVVPFTTVTAIHCEDEIVKIQVDSQPLMYLGSKHNRVGVITNVNVYDTHQMVDVTSGEASRCRIHKLTLRSQQAYKLKSYICHFDQRFQTLASIAIEEVDSEEPSEMILPPQTADKECPKKSKRAIIRQPPPVIPNPSEKELLLNSQVCSCRVSCRSLRCSCAKASRKCNSERSTCMCSDCDNPLNILEASGINPKLAVQDSCLFQNIYQVENLRSFLNEEYRMPCCNTIAILKECIPFRLLCPNTECVEIIEYSWCRDIVCSERNPRNHCTLCGRCKFSFGKHCEKCNTCYIAKRRSTICPTCNKPQEEHSEVIVNSLLQNPPTVSLDPVTYVTVSPIERRA